MLASDSAVLASGGNWEISGQLRAISISSEENTSTSEAA